MIASSSCVEEFASSEKANEAQNRIKRNNQLLFVKNSEFMSDLDELIEESNHRAMVLWAFEFADETVHKLLERYPNEARLETAVQKSKDWAKGKVKMSVAKHAILQAHAVAKEINSLEDIALCHAVGQACSIVHTKGHAIGFPIYDLTAIIRRYGIPECKRAIEERKHKYIERIYYWRDNYNDYSFEWADFMMIE